MNELKFYKLAYSDSGRYFDLFIVESWGGIGVPASLIVVYEKDVVVGSVRFTPRLTSLGLVLAKHGKVFQKQIDDPAIKKFKEFRWIDKILKKNNPDFIFEESLDLV